MASELRHRLRAAAAAHARRKESDPHELEIWFCEGTTKQQVRGARNATLETLLQTWGVAPAGDDEDRDVHFLNESTGLVIPRCDEIGKYVSDHDVVRACSSDELGALLLKFAERDQDTATELMTTKPNTPLSSAISSLKRFRASNSTFKRIQKTFDDSPAAQEDEAALLEKFPEVDPIFESGEVRELPMADNVPRKCDLCDVSWPDEAPLGKMFRHNHLGVITHEGCTQFTADVLAQHPEITTRAAFIDADSTVSQVNRPGTFHVTVHRATDLPVRQWLGSPAPYAKLSLLPWKEPVQTKPADNDGEHPLWKSMHDNEMAFSHMYNSSITPIPLLEVEVWNSSFLSDDMVACALLDMTPLLRFPNIEVRRWFMLSSRTQQSAAPKVQKAGAARILLSIKFVPLGGKYTAGNEHKFRVHQLKSIGLAIPSCAACGRVIMNVLNGVWGYRCEFCGIDVHKGCIMKAMTNCACEKAGNENPSETSSANAGRRSRGGSSTEQELTEVVHWRELSFKLVEPGISKSYGRLFVTFDGLHLCTRQCQPEANYHAKNVFDGDTYCRVVLGSMVYETSPVLRSADPMYMERMCFPVRRRDAPFKIEVIDFNTDACIAEMRTTLFQLLQRDADLLVHTDPLLQSLRAPLRRLNFDEERVAPFEMPVLSDHERSRLVAPGDKKANATGNQKKLGFAMVRLEYVESKASLLRTSVEDGNELPEEKEFSVDSLKITIDRLGRIAQIAQWLDAEYADIVAWKNQRKSGFCFAIFVVACVCVNLEYLGAYVMVGVLVYMLYQLRLRLEGQWEQRWVGNADYEEAQSTRLKLQRPVADLLVAVHEAKISESTERLLSTSLSALRDVTAAKPTFYVLVTYVTNDDQSASTTSEAVYVPSQFHQAIVGWTHSVEQSLHPSWRCGNTPASSAAPPTRPQVAPFPKQRKELPFRNYNVSWRHEPSTCKCDQCTAWREKEPVESVDEVDSTALTGCGVDHHALFFPVLQACRKKHSGRQDLAPWKVFPGALRFDLCISLTGEAKEIPDLIVATGSVPLRDARSTAGSTHERMVPLRATLQPDEVAGPASTEGGQANPEDASAVELLVRVELCTSGANSARAADRRLNVDRMVSQYGSPLKRRVSRPERVFSEFVCESLAEKERSSAVLGGQLLDALWKVKETIKTLQSDLDNVCDVVARVENLLNWTHPWKSAALCAMVAIGAFLLASIPGRWIVLIFGLTEFGAVFWEDLPPSNRLRRIVINVLSSLPTDQDLIQAYSSEREVYVQQQHGEREKEDKAAIRLRLFALWTGTIQSKGERDRSYKTYFVALRPFRFVLWKSTEDAVACAPPHLQLLFDTVDAIDQTQESDGKTFAFCVRGATTNGKEETRSFSFESSDQMDEVLQCIQQSCEGRE